MQLSPWPLVKTLAVSNDKKLLDELARLVSEVAAVGAHASVLGGLDEVVSQPGRADVDVLLLDASDTSNALTNLPRVQRLHPGLHVVLMVRATTPELLLQALRLGVREVIHLPLAAAEVRAAFERLGQGEARAPGQVLAFMPAKGGSGASFIATNFAHTLAAQSSKSVLVIDLNMHFGEAALLVSDRRPGATVADLLRDISRIDASLLKSAVIEVEPNFHVLAAPDDPAAASEIRAGHIDALIRFARTQFDFVVLDTPRTLDACTLAALDVADRVHPVLQLNLPALRNGRRMIEMFRVLEYDKPKVRPILNRVERGRSDLTVNDAERVLDWPIHASLPNDWASVSAAIEQGLPLAKVHPASAVVRGLRELCFSVIEKPPAARAGILARFMPRRFALAGA